MTATPKELSFHYLNKSIRADLSHNQHERQRPLYDFTRAQGPLSPLNELESFLGGTIEFLPHRRAGDLTDTERKFFDFNWWLSHNLQYDPEFASAQLIPLEGHHEKTLNLIKTLRKRYDKTSGESETSASAGRVFTKRLRQLYFWLWYTVLALNVERENEFEHFTELMGCACCAIQLENVSLCIQLFAGQRVEDRDAFLARLRPHFANALQSLQGKVTTCNCNEGLS
jgi:hypothetical protein